MAKRTLDVLVAQYMRACSERALGVTEEGLEALRAKGEELRPQLEAKAAQLQEFITRHNMVSLEQSQDIIVERLKEISRNLTEAEAKRIQTETRLKNIQDVLPNPSAPEDMPEVIDSPTVRDLKLEYVKMKLSCTDLAGSLGPKPPPGSGGEGDLVGDRGQTGGGGLQRSGIRTGRLPARRAAGRLPAVPGLRVVGLDQREQLRPRDHGVPSRRETAPAWSPSPSGSKRCPQTSAAQPSPTSPRRGWDIPRLLPRRATYAELP